LEKNKIAQFEKKIGTELNKNN